MRPQRSQKRLDECDNRLSIKNVNDFINSGIVQHAKGLVRQAAANEELTINELCEIRDYIIAILTIRTGTRPGALAAAKCQHYNTMRVDANTGYKVLLVPEH